MYSNKELVEKIECAVENLRLNKKPDGLYDPISYVLSIGGKRIRPTLLLLAYNLYGEEIEKAMSAALAVETYHNFTLLHDDLMDCADKRRGKDTVHKVWNDNTAILSGDAMLILSYHYLSQSSSNYLSLVLPEFTKFALEICEGQQYDMEFEKRTDVLAEEYLDMIKLKTSVLLAGSMKIGAILGGASAKDQELLYHVGLNVGLAFQLKDDLLDVYGDPKVFGKNLGGDIVSNKKTYLLIKALERADEEQKYNLLYWLGLNEFDAEEKIKAVTELYNELKIKDLVENKMDSFYNQALIDLEKVSVPKDKKNELLVFINKLMEREL